MDGFKVIVEELEAAANKIFAASDTADSVSPGSVKAEEDVTGHAGLTKAVTEFGETWDLARQTLQYRATEFAGALKMTGQEYERLDEHETARHQDSGGR